LSGRRTLPATEHTPASGEPHSVPQGLGWALAIVTAWLVSLLMLLVLPLQGPWLPPRAWLPLILLRTVLQTGLFIVGHDAMHGSLLPGSVLWTERIGRLVLALYAGLPWELSCRQHHSHHQAPGSLLDPDHQGARPGGPLRWYRRFMASYLSVNQLAGLIGAWLVALALLRPLTPHPLASLLLFWILPLVLSSLQLFLVGTYLPHRQGEGRSVDRHRAASLPWPEALSFLACYHFGYHWEHHRHPHLPWYRLPAARRLMTVPGGMPSPLAPPDSRR
jgi:beta-carotene ketolase (CrtW type)